MIILSDSTEKLLKPIEHPHDNDFLHLGLNKDGSRFLLHLYSQHDREKKEYFQLQTDASGSLSVAEVRAIQADGYEFDYAQRQKDYSWISYFSRKVRVKEKRNPSFSCTRIIRRFPEAHQVSTGEVDGYHFELPTTDYTVEILSHVWPAKANLLFDVDAKLVFDTLKKRGKSEDSKATAVAEFKKHKMVPFSAQGLKYNEKNPLAPYQKVAAINAYFSNYALFMKQGTGKTPVAISVICNEADTNNFSTERMYRVLIVCPVNVRENWAKEFQKFATTHGKVTILEGTQIERIGQIAEAFTIDGQSRFTAVICSYETLSGQTWEALKLIEWDRAILDESHYIKNFNRKRTKAALNLRDHSATRMILTGTPTSNSYFELFPQLEFLDEGGSGFSSFEQFKKFYAQYEQQNGKKVITSYRNIPFLQERLARKSYMCTKEEVLPDMPKKMWNTKSIEMSEEQRQIYKEVASALFIEAEADLAAADAAGQSKELLINNILKKFLKLAQITSGFIKWDPIVDDDGNEIRPGLIDRFDPDFKLEQLISDLKEKNTEEPKSKTIVWSCWTQNIKTIAARLRYEKMDHVVFYGQTSKKDRDEAERRFNCDPNCKIFVGNPSAGGTGLNLVGFDPDNPDRFDTNCDWMVYYSQDWSMVTREQSEDRFHRYNTRVPVLATDYVVPKTIDELIRARVVEKRMSSYRLADLKEVMGSILDYKEKGVKV